MSLLSIPLTATLTLGLVSCATPLLAYSASDMPPLQLAVVGQPSVQDGRTRFRTLFCELAARETPHGLDCEKLLVRLAGEPEESAPAPLPAHDPRLHLLMVPGGFAECFKDAALLPEAVPRLRSAGYPVSTVPISGRSSSTYNTYRIAAAVAHMQLPADSRLVLVGYSKGVVDILEFLVQYPSLAARVHAVVSISGSVNGSPVANRYGFLYRATEDWILRDCPPGDRGISVDLERERRQSWLARQRFPGHIRYFSIASIAPPEERARAFLHIGGSLRYIDPLHDGQLIFYDQLLPGSELLGYIRADHWAGALPLQEHWHIMATNPAGTHFPRGLLLEAIMLRVSEALRDKG
jgi:hypothetical protein